MSWISQLYQTYEKRIGKELNTQTEMAPVAHMIVKAQLEVTLNRKGDFENVSCPGKNESATLIPVTESSAGRSSGSAPHALCDMLPYIAGDFADHCENAKQGEDAKNKFEDYIGNLKKWVESENSHPSVRIIYQYLAKGQLISDLIRAGVIQVKDDQAFENKKIGGQSYDKVMVRFRILNAEYGKDATWKDSTLFENYTNYYLRNYDWKKDICYYTGKESVISTNHPKRIASYAKKATSKLISSNDKTGFTYRGRFQNAEQAVALSYDASQKIHNALIWLIENHGAVIETRVFLLWNPEGNTVPNPLDDTQDIFGESEFSNEDETKWTELSYRKKLRLSLKGYREQFEDTDSVVVMVLDAATKGRLSVTYYQELRASDYLDRFEYWQETCKWYFPYSHENTFYGIKNCRIIAPTLRRIVECAFGQEQVIYNKKTKKYENVLVVDDKVLKMHIQRLVQCMIEKNRVPFDLVQALTIRASTPTAYSPSNWEQVLSTACAMISKYRLEREGEQPKMKLNKNNSDRSYLFGRLLAVFDQVERSTYDKKEMRETNAIRLQSAYVNHPMQTWKNLQQVTAPYFEKQKYPWLREYYKNIISEITETFRDEDEAIMNQSLRETYLLGYYLQRAELNRKKDGGKENV